MARARQVKPGFFTDEDLGSRSPLARLLFAGLWTQADRSGRLEERPVRLKLEILPYDDCDVTVLLDELAVPKEHGVGAMITRYTAPDGRKYIQVNCLGKHQHFHPKEPKTVLPGPDAAINEDAAALPVRPGPAETLPVLPGRAETKTSGSSFPSIPSGPSGPSGPSVPSESTEQQQQQPSAPPPTVVPPANGNGNGHRSKGPGARTLREIERLEADPEVAAIGDAWASAMGRKKRDIGALQAARRALAGGYEREKVGLVIRTLAQCRGSPERFNARGGFRWAIEHNCSPAYVLRSDTLDKLIPEAEAWWRD